MYFNPLFLVIAGSFMRPVFFEVSKCEGSTDAVLKVSVPRELRGASEIMVFISEDPVSGINHMHNTTQVHVNAFYTPVDT